MSRRVQETEAIRRFFVPKTEDDDDLDRLHYCGDGGAAEAGVEAEERAADAAAKRSAVAAALGGTAARGNSNSPLLRRLQALGGNAGNGRCASTSRMWPEDSMV
jgi:hypothetical protein